jgi:tetratricopeptide (TPR) repeat protein
LPADKTKKAPPLAAFLSYAKPDFEKAQDIADQLEAHGFKCWIAPRDVRPGRAYGDEIIRGIERAQAFVLVLSGASNGSGFVSREIERAVSKNKHIFTIRIEDVQPAPALELFVSSTQWIDAFKGRLSPHIDRLAQLLAEDEDVTTPSNLTAAPRPSDARPFWRSPLVLGGLAAAAIGALGLFGSLYLRGEAPADIAVLTGTCKRISGEAGLAACDRALASGKVKGAELASLYTVRGYRRHQKHDIEGALADYRQAIDLDPTVAETYNARGTIYRDAGDYDRAIADFDAAIALKDWADPYASRGWVYAQKGEQERARQDYEKALAFNPEPELMQRLQAALGNSAGSETSGEGVRQGFFGPDTRKALSEFSEDERAKLAASYGYVGTLMKGHLAVCNATLVGRNQILTSDYCFDGSGLANYSFRVSDREGRPLESKITQTAVSEVIRGVDGKQRVSVAVLATPLGDEIGFVERVGGEPAVGAKLDIVALDLRPNAQNTSQLLVSGAATGDENCTVLASEAKTDIFTHHCISPMGSGGAPIFDAATGTLVGIIGGSEGDIAWAYRTTAVPGLIQQTAAR